jgi:hypothetical protein
MNQIERDLFSELLCCDQITRLSRKTAPLAPADPSNEKGPKSPSCAHGRTDRNLNHLQNVEETNRIKIINKMSQKCYIAG